MKREPVLVDLAFQGGGSHGAFTWGVMDRLLEEESATVAELESLIRKPIEIQVEPLYSQEQYDVVLM